jgi:peptide/nickel transport system substrate-binding protein
MERQHPDPRNIRCMNRRELLKTGLAAGAALSTWPVSGRSVLWGQETGTPKRGGILHVRGRDPVHFDPHLSINVRTQSTLSFVYSKLVRHQVGAGVRPGTFIVEPDLAERWEEVDDTTYVFHLRKGVKWHNKPPVNGRELVADDVKFSYDRFLTEKGNADRYILEAVDRVEVVDRYSVKFLLKEPYVWLINVLANPRSMWVVAPEVVEKYGDLKKVETAIGTGPFILERYEPNVKVVFKRNPEYFLKDLPWVDGVEWLVLDDPSTALAMYRTGKLDAGPEANWNIRQQDLESVKKSHPHLHYMDWLSLVTQAIYLRNDQPPFNDVRVRRAISQALDRQAILESVYVRGEPTSAIGRGSSEWSLPVDQLGEGAKYYRYDPKEAQRFLAEAGFPKGFKTQINTTGGYGPDLPDAVQLAQRYLKDVGIEAEMKLQEYGAYMATTFLGKFEGMAMGPISIAWEPDSVLYGLYGPDQPRNSGHVNDPEITALLKEQRRTKDLEARKQLIFAIQRRAAEQQYYVYTNSSMLTGSWQPYVKNFAPNMTFDFGSRAAALWLDR